MVCVASLKVLFILLHLLMLASSCVAWVLRLPDGSKILPTTRSSRSSAAPCSTKAAANEDLFVEPRAKKAYPQQTPHSGRHFLPSHPAYQRSWWRRLWGRRRRFMEGWYYRLTLPDDTSFAFIVSIEDPGRQKSDLRLACIQVVGPDDGYLVQSDRDDKKFWAWKHQQGFGCTFALLDPLSQAKEATSRNPVDWYATVDSGFQMLPTHCLGRIKGHDGTQGGVLPGQGVPGSCSFDFSIDPICGWGDVGSKQKSTGGWLASFAVFEPHWQVTIADGRATGSIDWNNKTYNFVDAKFYSECNWGAALPSKWYWTQCNSFEGYDQLSVTAGGGIRKIPFGRKESLGMVSIHYNGLFYEAVPWSGSMEWEVTTWGSWELRGNSTFGDRPFEAVVTYECDTETTPGLVFRAPTPDQGMVYFCRDTFEADTTLTLWELEWNKEKSCYVRKPGPPLIDQAKSNQGGAEVGGGPWWDTWKGSSHVKQPIRALLQLPFRLEALRKGRKK
jgi:tocopherol cyclase